MSFKDKDLTKAKPMSSTKDKLPRIEDFYEIAKIKKDHMQGRIMPGYTSYAMYWVPIVGSKTGKEVRIPKPCLNYDPETEEFTDKECPYAKLGVTPQVKYLFNWLDREAQEDFTKSRANSKEKKSGLKDPSSKSKTPVFVIHGPPSIANKLQKLSELNKGKKNRKKKYAVSDPKEGIDVLLAFDGDKKGGDMYDIQRDEKTPLTKEEQEYLVWDLDAYPHAMLNSITLAEAKKDAKELLKVLNKGEIEGESGDDSEDDSEMDDDSKKSKKKSKGKDKKDSKKKSKKDESEESEDDSSEGSEDDDKSEESEIDLSEDDGSENSEDDSEDDKPKKKSKGKDKKASKKKSKKDESEDDDSEGDDSEDDDGSEESEKSEDDGSEDDSEESEEEKPKKKAKAKSKAKSKKSSKKKSSKKKSKKDDSEDDDSEDDSEDIPF